MRSIGKRVSKSKSIPINALYGTIIEVLLGLSLSAVLALLITNERFKMEWLQLGVPVMLMIISFVGSGVSIKKGKGPIAIQALATVALFVVLLIGANILVFDCDFYGVWIKLLMILIGASLGCVSSFRSKRKKPSR